MTSPSDYLDDPRLTAYVLGELGMFEAAELAREIEANPDMQSAVDELRDLIGDVTVALEGEPTPQLTAEQRATLETASVMLAESSNPSTPNRRFAGVMGMAASLVAFAELLVLIAQSENDEVSVTWLDGKKTPSGSMAPSLYGQRVEGSSESSLRGRHRGYSEESSVGLAGGLG
jgi:anti-sigma factor RsiW